MRQLIAKLRRQRLQAVPSFRCSHDTTNRREALRFEVACAYTVGCNHEVLDEGSRTIFYDLMQSSHPAMAHGCARFGAFEIERPGLVPPLSKPPRDLILDTNLIGDAVGIRDLRRHAP